MNDDIDPVAFDRWLVPGVRVLKLGMQVSERDFNGLAVFGGFEFWRVVVTKRQELSPGWWEHPVVLDIRSASGPVTALTLLHALHERGMLLPEAYEPVAP